MSYHQLVYISEAVSTINYSDIRGMLTASRIRNFRNNITGILFYRDGYFIQLLEGEYTKVHSSLERIKLDPRHKNINILAEMNAKHRFFEEWYMAFIDGDLLNNEVDKLDKLFSLSHQASVASEEIFSLIKLFSPQCACHL